MTSIWSNDRDLESEFNCSIIEPFERWTAVSQPQLEGIPLAGFHGQKPTAIGATAPPNQMTIGVLFRVATLAGRRAAFDAMVAHLSGENQIRFADDPERYVKAFLAGGEAQKAGIALVNPEAKIPFRFIAFDPLFYSRQSTELTIPNGKRVVVPCGTARSQGLLLLKDIVTSCIVRTRHGLTGEILHETTLTGSTGAGEYLRIDGELGTIKRISGSPAVETDAFSWKAVTDSFPSWDPADGPPTVEVTSATAHGRLIARKAHKS